MKKVFVSNYTMIPNAIIDSMGEMTECEFRVVMAVARKTFGWQKYKDRISLSQLKELTGLSKQGVIDGISSAIEHELIERHPAGQSFEYSILVNEVDQSEYKTSQRSRPALVNVVDQLEPELVNVVDTQKKGLKKEKEKGETTADALARTIKLYESNFGMITPMIAEELSTFLTEYPEEWIGNAFRESVTAGVRKLRYVEAILKRWKSDGYKSERPGKNNQPLERELPFKV